MVRSSTTGLPNSKIFLPNSNLDSLVAFSNLLKPRFGQKSRDATTIAPKMLDWKSRQEERGNGGNTGIHGKRTRWGSIPPKETERSAPKRKIRRSPPTAPVAEERDEQGERGERMGMGEKKTPPAPDITPCPRLTAVVPRWWAVVPLRAVVLHTTSGSTASATTWLLDQRLTLKKKWKAKPKEREDRRDNTHTHNRPETTQTQTTTRNRASSGLSQERAVAEATYV